MANLKLSGANANRLKQLKEKHGPKSLRKKDWDFMLNQILESVSESQWEKILEQHVPDDVVIRQALLNPESKKALAEYLRRHTKKPKSPAQTVSAESPVSQTISEPKAS